MIQGRYRRRDYWREPFTDGGRSVPWEEAVGRFRDATGQPGPATWKSGTFADAQAEFPVGGVSWYEAAAYAVFASKSLPTMYHWYRAAALGRFGDILILSNFGGKARHGSGVTTVWAFGTYDMAGNVKEWCWTKTGNRRFILGGAWSEPMYVFGDYDAKEPFDRAPSYGFQTAKYIGTLAPALAAPVSVEGLVRDPRKEKVCGASSSNARRPRPLPTLQIRGPPQSRALDGDPQRAGLSADREGGGRRRRTAGFPPP